MKKILKLTLFLFLMIFSLNVYSQSSEVKKLQDKIEEWKNYDFIAHVKNSDRDAIYSKFYNKAVISGVYPQWSSYSNSRPYEYIITPQFANGNYGNTETRLITMSESYTKEGFELYKKSEIEKVFKQIDEQIELEKNQEENRKATAQKNAERKSKRDAYVKNQIELIENKKDSIIIEIDRQKTSIKSWFNWHNKITLFLTPKLNFHKGDTILYYNRSGEIVSEEKRSTAYEPLKVKFSYGIDNSLLSAVRNSYNASSRGDAFFTSRGVRDNNIGFSSRFIEDNPSFKTFYNLELLKKQLVSLKSEMDKMEKYLDSNSKSFDEVKDEWDDRTEEDVVAIVRKRYDYYLSRYDLQSILPTPYSSCNYCKDNGLSDDIFNERLLRSYNYEIFKAKKEGYDYVYSPLVWKGKEMENLTNKLDKAINRFYEDQNYIESESDPGYTNILQSDISLVRKYMRASRMASKFLVWYQKVFPSGSRTYSGKKVREFIKCTSKFYYEEDLSKLIDTWISLREGFVNLNDDMIFSFINEIYAPDDDIDLMNSYIDYNKLNECLEELN